jgi:ribonuclease HIII
MEGKSSYTFELTPAQQAELTALLRSGNYRPCVVPHTIVAAEGDDVRINLYRSGKCLIQGTNALDFVTFVLEPLVLKAARIGYEDLLNPEIAQPHIGVDESGKGDFFGPLVTAGAYVDQTLIEPMRALGVRDSKKISSDKAALELARELQKLLGRRYSTVIIGPARYNALYRQMRSVNTMLAWAHARAIENLLAVVPDCPRAISDQFGNRAQVTRALMQRGRKIQLIQQHRAESDLAVAAASILARAAFLLSLKKMDTTYAQSFPKGASAAVIDAAETLVAVKGPEALLATAKCHFKTTDAVLARSGLTRAALGPDGAATSKPPRRYVRQAPAAAEEPDSA